MKAIVQYRYGGPEELQVQEVKKPEPGKDEVLIRIQASTVNRTDCAILRAKPFIMRFVVGLMKPANEIPGTDFAGVIEAVGEQVKTLKVGDRVFGFDDQGLRSKAEFMVLKESDPIGQIPDGYSFTEAAATLEGVHYAYNFINKVEVKEGDKVLLNGASGAIGLALLQLLNLLGAEVTAVGNTKSQAIMDSLGASKTIDYTQKDFTLLQEEFDLVFDAVGKSTFSKCASLLKSGGTYVSSELGPYVQNPILSLVTPYLGKKRVKFPIPLDIKRTILFITEQIKNGSYKPVIDQIFSLEETAEAYRYVEKGEKTGNVVITNGQN